ncbi:Piso0_002827 [Millerozyma farinosa CBS 7064]|uniref:Trafficking protein particle complex subunit n=1 Tax=Pichia sorbitophila (strain ATCC MYA-4447 / BCRC 22081 / CBS 7064 / NBRC 10061 / NRRL Y-12695) TaxID=559304 RepID=G8YDM1_PICSO|nr:Piso0_002827 [Millerozyma farinosa CBS 7064]
MKVYSCLILNKAGGLIYQNNVNPGLNSLSSNDFLVLAGTLHGVHAIASKIKPIPSQAKDDIGVTNTHNTNTNLIATGKSQNANSNQSGLQTIETDFFNLYIFQTLTGLKFVIVTSPNPVVHNLQPMNDFKSISRGELQKQYDSTVKLFRQLYLLFSDFVMKDPFYSLDMPVKSSLFDMRVKELLV